MNPPNHYLSASAIARPALEKLGITQDGECRLVVAAHHQWILRNAYLFNAVKYLWRCEFKGCLQEDLACRREAPRSNL
jgi:hypothetical protein